MKDITSKTEIIIMKKDVIISVNFRNAALLFTKKILSKLYYYRDGGREYLLQITRATKQNEFSKLK
jgi:hypothetical protein